MTLLSSVIWPCLSIFCHLSRSWKHLTKKKKSSVWLYCGKSSITKSWISEQWVNWWDNKTKLTRAPFNQAWTLSNWGSKYLRTTKVSMISPRSSSKRSLNYRLCPLGVRDTEECLPTEISTFKLCASLRESNSSLPQSKMLCLVL